MTTLSTLLYNFPVTCTIRALFLSQAMKSTLKYLGFDLKSQISGLRTAQELVMK